MEKSSVVSVPDDIAIDATKRLMDVSDCRLRAEEIINIMVRLLVNFDDSPCTCHWLIRNLFHRHANWFITQRLSSLKIFDEYFGYWRKACCDQLNGDKWLCLWKMRTACPHDDIGFFKPVEMEGHGDCKMKPFANCEFSQDKEFERSCLQVIQKFTQYNDALTDLEQLLNCHLRSCASLQRLESYCQLE